MPNAAFGEILRAAALDPGAAQGVRIDGADPVLPVRYRIGTAGAAALAAFGYGASRLWVLRGHAPQTVTVDLRAAVASLRSARYLRINGKPMPDPFDPLSGFYPVSDGWVQLHCNFPHHREAAFGVLGVAPERAAGEAASRAWSGGALEDAVHAAGGCAAYVRSAAQWAMHPHAQALADEPLLEIRRIGDAPPEALPAGKRPLAALRVLDLTRVLAGPTCARCLAEQGADVLKITASHLPDSGGVELDTGIGKRSARVDLRGAGGVEVLRELVRDADVFSQSYRPGALDGYGFSPEDLCRLRPGIVCVTLSAWGTHGPWRARRGFDTIVQSASGIADANHKDGRPRFLPVSAIDYISGYLMAFGATIALERRAREGGSWLVRVALARTGKWITDLGTLPPTVITDLPSELPPYELERLFAEIDAPDGRIRHLAPVAQLSQTPGHWTRPPVPLGHDESVWLPRDVGVESLSQCEFDRSSRVR